MVQPLNQVQGYTQVGEQAPLALSKTETPPPTVQTSQGADKAPPVQVASSQDLSQAAQVQPNDNNSSIQYLAQDKTAISPSIDFSSNLGNVLGSILDLSKGDDTQKNTSANPGGNKQSSSSATPDQKNTPDVKPQKQETPVPGLEGYNSVLPDTNTGKGGDVNAKDRAAIRTIESGSAKGNYQSVGKATRTGDRAYGAYQIMGANIPAWSKKYLGKTMSISEFMNDPDAQDKIFGGEFGRLKQKYGGPGAAQAWFAGEAGMKNKSARDVNGTTVADYGAKYTKFYG